MSEHTLTREEVIAEARRYETKASNARKQLKQRPGNRFWARLNKEYAATARILRALAPPAPPLEPLVFKDENNGKLSFEATFHPDAAVEPFASHPVRLLVSDATDESRWAVALLSPLEADQLRNWLSDALG